MKALAEGKLGTAENGKPITLEQMEISRLRAEVARLKMEMEIAKNRRVLCEGVAVRYAFIDHLRSSYPVQALCAALQVSDSGFAAWQRGEGPKKWLSDSELLQLIREIHQETKAAYGSPRIFLEVKGCGIPVSKGGWSD